MSSISARSTLLVATLAAVAGVLSISACSSEENPPAGSVAVAVAPTSINVAQGGTGNAAATITRGGSFTGAVTLTQAGAPTGMTVTFDPAVIPAGSTASTVNVAVGGAVAAGNHDITISADGDNVETATATLTVAVVAGGAGSIALAANPTALTAAVGAAAVTSAITITRTAPFAGAVALAVTGAPANVQASVTPASATGNTATLSVSSATGAVNGTYPLVVRGTGTGVSDATTTVNVTVTGGAAQGIAFAFNPASVPITAGGANGTSAVTITRNGGFTGGVNLALSGAPTGLTASVTPNSNVTGTAATVTVQASAAVAAGTYDLTLTGTGTGIPNATGTLPVVVTSGGGGGNATFTWCADNAPLWVASQDGTGAWTQRTPTTTGGTTYQFTFASGKGGVAFVQSDGSGGTELSVIYGTLAEFNGVSGGVGLEGCGSKTVNGSVASVGATETATVYLGSANVNTSPSAPGFPNFALSNVPDGSLDLIATRTAAGAFVPNQIILRRGLNQANNSTITPGLDFGTQGFAPSAAYNVTVTNLGADPAIITNHFLGNGTTYGGTGTILGYTSGAVPYNSVPLAQLNAGDLQQLFVFAGDAANSNAARFAGVYYHTPATKTIAMGPALSAPTVSKFATTPYVQPRVVLPYQAEYNKLLIVDYAQSTTPNRAASVAATAAYFASGTAAWTVTFPNLSAATGWNNAWGLVDGTPINWNLTAQGGTILQIAPPTDGTTIQFAGLSSGSTPLTVRSLRTGAGPLMQRGLLDVLKR